MKNRRILICFMLLALLLVSVSGCKKNTGSGQDGANKPTAQIGLKEATPEPTAAATPEATATPTPAPTEAPTPTEEPGPVLMDEKAAGWREWTSPEGIEAANLYASFINGEVKASISEDTFYISAGERDIKDLIANMAQNLVDYMLPGTLSGAHYAIIDCGADHYPELALMLVFDEDTPYGEQAIEYVILKAVDGRLKVLDTFQSYYRSFTSINRFGYIAYNGSGGAALHTWEYSFINADGEKIIDYIDDQRFDVRGMRIPSEALPRGMAQALAEYADDDNGHYTVDTWSYKAMDWGDIITDDYDMVLANHYRDCVFTFYSEHDDGYVVPDADYVQACAQLGLTVCSMSEQIERRDAHRKEIGLTEEIIDGGDSGQTFNEPDWIMIEGLGDIKGQSGSSTGSGSDSSLKSGTYDDFLGIWYLMRGAVEGDDWEAEDVMNIRYLTFRDDMTVERRIDYELDYSDYYYGSCEFYTDDNGAARVLVYYEDEGDPQAYVYGINEEGLLIENGNVMYDGEYIVDTYAEFARKPFWGDGGFYYEVMAPVMPEAIQAYIDRAKPNEWLVALADPDESIIRACEENRWELHDETSNEWINCPWNNPKELIIANASERTVDLEVHEPKSGYDTKSSSTDWEAGPFFYAYTLKPGQLARMIVDMPQDPVDATMCLYMTFEGDDHNYLIRIYRYDKDDPYLQFGE